MEVKGEKTVDFGLFFYWVNYMLQDFTNDQDAKFRPKYFMCDAAGANFNAIQEVFGKEVHQLPSFGMWHNIFLQITKF